jgi:hypothetical protein
LFGAVDDTVLTAARPALATLGLFFICVAIWPKPGARSRGFMIAITLIFAAQYGWWRITQTLPPAAYTFEYALAFGFLIAEMAGLLAAAPPCCSSLERAIDPVTRARTLTGSPHRRNAL